MEVLSAKLQNDITFLEQPLGYHKYKTFLFNYNTTLKKAKKLNSDKKRKTVNIPLVDKLQLLPACSQTCRKRCYERLTSDPKKSIFEYFELLDFGQRQLSLNKYILKQQVKYRKVDAERNRNFSVSYNFPLTNLTQNEIILNSSNDAESTLNQTHN